MADVSRDAIKANGWRQGSCFTAEHWPDLSKVITEAHRIDEAVYICITHDCCVINPDLEGEPHLEYVLALPIDGLDGNYTYAKNIRRLHIELVINGEKRPYELLAHRRGYLPREPLQRLKPAVNIKVETESHGLLARWLANRYTATAFPDTFESRINSNKVRERLKRLLKDKLSTDMIGIWVTLEPGRVELEEREQYEITVLLVYTHQAFEKI